MDNNTISLVYLYAENDELAELILAFTALPASERRTVLSEVKTRSAKKKAQDPPA